MPLEDAYFDSSTQLELAFPARPCRGLGNDVVELVHDFVDAGILKGALEGRKQAICALRQDLIRSVNLRSAPVGNGSRVRPLVVSSARVSGAGEPTHCY